jgi:predicted transcriptional regulator
MNINSYCAVFEVLGFEPRLKIFDWIIKSGSKGAAPKEIIEKFGFDSGTLSFHLKKLQKVNLIIRAHSAGIRYYVSPSLPASLKRFFCGDSFADVFEDKNQQLVLI